MRNIGSTLLFFGIGSVVLNFFNYDFAIVSWVDMWGETTGWAIRAVMIVAGIGLFFMGGRAQDDRATATEAPRQEPTMEAAAPVAQAEPPPAPAPEPAPADLAPGSDPMGSMQNR